MDKIFNTDCLTGLKTLAENSVDCCVTSPPYYGLRDYGHADQIGLEQSPEEYVAKMVEVFTEVRRVLKPEGTLWLNLGDSYASSGISTTGRNDEGQKTFGSGTFRGGTKTKLKIQHGCKPKDLIGIPWMVAFALRSSGWYLRQDIIWRKKNCLPESVKDRCTKTHEYFFLLAKSSKYYFNSDAIMEPVAESTAKDTRYINERFTEARPERGFNGSSQRGSGKLNSKTPGFKNKRSVWDVSTKPFKEAHFATFPPDLIEPCILAGCPEGGLVLDPFMGAGTTAIVAERLGRKYVGFEINPDYVKIAEKRILDAWTKMILE